MKIMYRMTIESRGSGKNGMVREVRFVNSDMVRLVLLGFGHTQESIGFVDVTPGQDKAQAVESYLTANNL